MRTIRASEIGAYLYCKRAWMYRKKGVDSTNVTLMRTGTAIHEAHGRSVAQVGCIRAVAVLLFLGAVTLMAIYLTNLLLARG